MAHDDGHKSFAWTHCGQGRRCDRLVGGGGGTEDEEALQVKRIIIWAHRLAIILMVMAKLFVRTGNKDPAAGASGNYLPLVHLDVTIEKKMLDMLEDGLHDL